MDVGRDYNGSRDIDIGFHVDSEISAKSIQKSSIKKIVSVLKSRNFFPLGSRYVACHSIETKERLTEEESKSYHLHELFYHYVDPIVDQLSDSVEKVFGFKPIDEKLLRYVFNDNMFVTVKAFGLCLKLPTPEVLLATKINAVQGRGVGKEDKRIKDIVDIYALIWYSGIEIDDLVDRILKILYKRQVLIY